MEPPSTWEGKVHIIKQDSIPKNKFQTTIDERQEKLFLNKEDSEEKMIEENMNEENNNIADFQLDGNVRFWSDYNKNYLHPKSFFLNQKFNMDDYFDVYNWGSMTNIEKEDYFENLRFFVEECERFIGFQTFVDLDNANGCAASDIFVELRDEFPKKTILTFGNLFTQSLSSSTSEREKNERITLNHSLSLSNLKQFSDLIVLLSLNELEDSNRFPFLDYNIDDKYQTSSIFASSIETCTLPYRLKQNKQTFSGFTSHLARTPSTNISALSTSFPLPVSHDINIFEVFRDKEKCLYKAEYMSPLSPIEMVKEHCEPFCESVFIRGVPEWALKKSGIDDFGQMDLLFNNLIQYQCPHRYFMAHNEPSMIPVPYPYFFKQNISEDGIIMNSDSYQRNQQVKSIPMLTHLQTTSQIRPFFKDLSKKLKNIDIRFHTPPYEIEKVEFDTIKENIFRLYDEYSL